MSVIKAKLRFRRMLTASCILFLCLSSYGQADLQPIPDIYHTSWSTREGAPRGVTSLAQTRDGYLWIGTILGLYRFDGTRFSSYTNEEDGVVLPSTNITSLAADEDNGLWVGYARRGLSHIVRGRVTNISLPHPFEKASVDSVYCCSQNSMWVLAGDTILRWHDSSWEDFAKLHGLPHTTFFTLFFDREGNIWTASRNTVYELREGSSQFLVVPADTFSVTQFAEDKDGAIWISDGWHSVRPLRPGNRDAKFPLHGVASFLFDPKGRLWMATDGHGIQRASVEAGHLNQFVAMESFVADNGLTSNLTQALLLDRFGDVWVGTEMGIDRFRPRNFEPFGKQDFKFYPAVAPAPDGSIWILEHARKLVHVVGDRTREIGPVRGISPLATDGSSGVWLLDPWKHSLLHYNAADKLDRTVFPPLQFHDTAAQSIVSRPDGSLLVDFEGNGLWSYSKAWRQVEDLPMEDATALDQDANTTWIGYPDNVVIALDGNHTQKYDAANGLNIDTPLVFAHQDHALWVGGVAGVNFMADGRFHPLLVRRPEVLRGISGIEFDDDGNLWLNSGFGAMEITTQEIAGVLKDPSHRATTHVYGSADGVIGIPAQIKPVPSLAKDGIGRLWFATAGNLVSVMPHATTSSRPLPTIVLESVQINEKQIPFPDDDGRSLILDGGRENRIEFEYTAIDIDHPNHIVYRYRLQGEDTNWQNAGRNHEAAYSKLLPGHYAFQVAAANGDDRWTELSSAFSFDIRPAFYQTTWFLMLCWLTAILFLFLLYLARVQYISARLRDRLEERSNERLRIARELHDTLLQSIHGLMLRFHYATDSLDRSSPARPALEAALRRADDLILEGRNSVQHLRGEADKTKELPELLADVVNDAATESSRVEITEEGIAYHLRPLVQEELCKIGREAILNALHHAQSTQVRVKIRYGRRFFKLTCRDNGVGIPADVVQAAGKNGHWGLKGMRERARSIGADLTILTNEGQGTEIQVRLLTAAAIDRPRLWRRFFASHNYQ